MELRMPTKPTNEILTVRLPQELLERIDEAAAKELLSRSSYVRKTPNSLYREPAQRVPA
jgi:metal-responsive CopG/Arc/MetJ family transcriptional regulator